MDLNMSNFQILMRTALQFLFTELSTNLISQQTLRRIKSDVKSLERFSNDDAVGIVETQKHFRSVLPRSNTWLHTKTD